MKNNIYNIIKKSIKYSTGRNKANLHEPIFFGKEKKYLQKCIDTTFVSSAGKYISMFEKKLSKFTKSKNVIAVLNGTIALQVALKSLGIKKNDEVLIPTVTFVGTANAIKHCDAIPHFIDTSLNSLGISVEALDNYLKKIAIKKNKFLFNKKTKRRIFAIIPVHVFGHISKIDDLVKISKKYNLKMVEDGAEALGSFYKNKHAGTFGDLGIISFNGNKIITTGGGGAILCNNNNLAKKIRHLVSTAKKSHKWSFFHDRVAWNYRMPNINAAIGLAQMEKIKKIINLKYKITKKYKTFFKNNHEIQFIDQPKNCKSNFWLNTIRIKNLNISKRNKLLNILNYKDSMNCRPVWNLIHNLPMFRKCPKSNLSNAKKIEKEFITLPSSPIYGK